MSTTKMCLLDIFCLLHGFLISITNSFSSRILFGSCVFPYKSTKIFEAITKRNADLFIWTGDVTYIDYEWVDPSSGAQSLLSLFKSDDIPPLSEWNAIYNTTKNDKFYKNLVETEIPIIGIYDDHDFGKNNLYGADWKYRNFSQFEFLNFLNIPQNDDKRNKEGINEHYSMKIDMPIQKRNITKIIDIILLDDRYFAKVDGKENILGDQQWDWLENIIKNKTNGELTILISGIQIIPVSRTAEENWSNDFNKSQKKLIDLLIKYNKNKRLLLITGDIHRGEILKTQCINQINGDKQNIYEITSSGLTHAIGDIEAYLIRIVTFIQDYLLWDGIYLCKYWGRNFGEINIEWKWNDTTQDVEIINVNNSIMDLYGSSKCSFNLPLWEDDVINYNIDNSGLYLWEYNNYKCYGGKKQYSKREIQTVSLKNNFIYTIIYGYLFVFILYYLIKIGLSICKCCNSCKECTTWMYVE